jgi:predicted transcriptional regulator
MPIPNAFAQTLKDTLEEIGTEQVDVAKPTGIPASHLSAMKNGNRRVTPEYD